MNTGGMGGGDEGGRNFAVVLNQMDIELQDHLDD